MLAHPQEYSETHAYCGYAKKKKKRIGVLCVCHGQNFFSDSRIMQKKEKYSSNYKK